MDPHLPAPDSRTPPRRPTLEAELRHELSALCGEDVSWAHLLEREDCLRVLFNYQSVYQPLGSTVENLEEGLYTLFKKLFNDWGTPEQFNADQAYAHYAKFPIDACATRLSSESYSLLARVFRVDEHFVRAPLAAHRKFYLPKDFRMKNGTRTLSGRESTFMVGGTGLKKSSVLKILKRMVREGGGKGLKDVFSRLHFNLVEGAAKKSRQSEAHEEECEGAVNTEKSARLEWLRWNERQTWEGLIDIASAIHWDGPRCFLCADELSLVIGSVASKKSGGCMSFDDLICFLDEERARNRNELSRAVW